MMIFQEKLYLGDEMNLQLFNLLKKCGIIFFGTILFFTFQAMAKSSITKEQAAEVLKLATEKAAPDNRVSYFNIKAQPFGTKIILTGKVLTDDQKVIVHAAFQKLGDVDNKIEVFPFSDIGRNKSYGITKSPVLNIRGANKHSSELISQALMGSTMLILEAEEKWLKVQFEEDKYIGWVEKSNVVMTDSQNMESWKNEKKIMITKPINFLYAKPDVNSPVVAKIYYTTKLTLTQMSTLEQNKNFYKVQLPYGPCAFLKIENAKIDPSQVASDIVKKEIVNEAKKFLTTPYLWGGTTSMMTDCSGFTQTIYKFYGYSLPRDADQQQSATKPVNKIEELKVGDLVFFPGHVGMYIGNMKFIHSSASLGGVSISSFDPKASDYFEWCAKNFKGGGRVLE